MRYSPRTARTAFSASVSCAPVKAAISELFISGALGQAIPDDHVLVRVDRVLDLSWLRD